MPDFISTILAKALVMLVEALIAQLMLYLLRSGRYQRMMAAAR